MIFLSLICLLAAAVMFFLGSFGFARDPKATVNRLFFCYCLAGTYGSFMEFNIVSAETLERVYVWIKLYSLIWPLLLAFQLHFVLVFTEKNKLLSHSVTKIFMYAPAIVFSVLGQTAGEFVRSPVKMYGGWALLPPETTGVVLAANAWIVFMAIIPIALCLIYALRQTDRTRQAQARYVSIGLFANMFWSVVTQGVFPEYGITIPQLISTGAFLGAGFYGYAILKHGLFTLSPTLPRPRASSQPCPLPCCW